MQFNKIIEGKRVFLSTWIRYKLLINMIDKMINECANVTKHRISYIVM